MKGEKGEKGTRTHVTQSTEKSSNASWCSWHTIDFPFLPLVSLIFHLSSSPVSDTFVVDSTRVMTWSFTEFLLLPSTSKTSIANMLVNGEKGKNIRIPFSFNDLKLRVVGWKKGNVSLLLSSLILPVPTFFSLGEKVAHTEKEGSIIRWDEMGKMKRAVFIPCAFLFIISSFSLLLYREERQKSGTRII